MSSQLGTSIDRPIKSAVLLDDYSSGAVMHERASGDVPGADPHIQGTSQQSEQVQHQMELFVQANETLNALTAKLHGYSSELLTRHKEEIAQLSIEIARRVLAQRIEDGDYDIEQVIKEAIGSVPTDGDLLVRVNPEDLALLQAALQESGRNDQPENVKLVADASVGRAECLVETPKGLVESRINEKLEQISGALKKAQ